MVKFSVTGGSCLCFSASKLRTSFSQSPKTSENGARLAKISLVFREISCITWLLDFSGSSAYLTIKLASFFVQFAHCRGLFCKQSNGNLVSLPYSQTRLRGLIHLQVYKSGDVTYAHLQSFQLIGIEVQVQVQYGPVLSMPHQGRQSPGKLLDSFYFVVITEIQCF